MACSMGIARMAQRWGDTPKPSPAKLTTLRHLQSDLGPFRMIRLLFKLQSVFMTRCVSYWLRWGL
jgi:hypothetical protein